MTNKEFINLRVHLHDHCTKLLARKKDEYSDGIDRLVQFKNVAAFRETSPADALAGMMIKHESSIHQMINFDAQLKASYSLEQWLEKIADLRNYLDLLWAVVNEETL